MDSELASERFTRFDLVVESNELLRLRSLQMHQKCSRTLTVIASLKWLKFLYPVFWKFNNLNDSKHSINLICIDQWKFSHCRFYSIAAAFVFRCRNYVEYVRKFSLRDIGKYSYFSLELWSSKKSRNQFGEWKLIESIEQSMNNGGLMGLARSRRWNFKDDSIWE